MKVLPYKPEMCPDVVASYNGAIRRAPYCPTPDRYPDILDSA